MRIPPWIQRLFKREEPQQAILPELSDAPRRTPVRRRTLAAYLAHRGPHGKPVSRNTRRDRHENVTENGFFG